jgi:hypothetical protein
MSNGCCGKKSSAPSAHSGQLRARHLLYVKEGETLTLLVLFTYGWIMLVEYDGAYGAGSGENPPAAGHLLYQGGKDSTPRNDELCKVYFF